MKHGSLFSGIGGFDLAAHWAGIDTVFACEIDEWNRKVLAKRFPNTTIYSDIKEVNFEQYRGTVDVISGGFPCQPFSLAGKRRGTTDDRYLWGEMLRVVREVKPTWVIAENVRGLTTIEGGDTFETVCDDLEISGYEVQPFIIPALSVGACHQRERLWIVAYRNRLRQNKGEHECGNFSEQIPQTPSGQLGRPVCISHRNPSTDTPDTESFGFDGRGTRTHSGGNDKKRLLREGESDDRGEVRGETSSGNIDTTDTSNSKIQGLERRGFPQLQRPCTTEHYRRPDWSENWPEALARIYGMDDGLSGGMDRLDERYKDRSRKNRIKAMGNAIVPQVAYQIFQTIREVESVYSVDTN